MVPVDGTDGFDNVSAASVTGRAGDHANHTLVSHSVITTPSMKDKMLAIIMSDAVRTQAASPKHVQLRS
jgi:hypothetical protein